MQVLPILDEQIISKMLLFMVRSAKKLLPGSDPAERKAFRAKITAELPAFVRYLHEFEIPRRLQDNRYGIKSYANPILLKLISDLDPLVELLSLVQQTLKFSKDYGELSWITATDLFKLIFYYEYLREGLKHLGVHTATSLGIKLSELSKHRGSGVYRRMRDGYPLYQIAVPDLKSEK